MSGQPTANYGGKQPDNSTYIKQFNSTASGYASWIFKKFNNIITNFYFHLYLFFIIILYYGYK